MYIHEYTRTCTGKCSTHVWLEKSKKTCIRTHFIVSLFCVSHCAYIDNISTYMHVGICMCVCVCVCMYVLHVQAAYACTHGHTSLWNANPHTSKCHFRANVWLSIYIYIYIYIYIHVYLYTHERLNLYIYIYIYIYTYVELVHACMRAHLHARTCAYQQSYSKCYFRLREFILSSRKIYKEELISVLYPVLVRAICIHTYIHTYIHVNL